MADQAELLARTTEIFAAHVAKNAVAVDQIPAPISSIHQTLAGLGVDEPDLTPAVPIRGRSARRASSAWSAARWGRCSSATYPRHAV